MGASAPSATLATPEVRDLIVRRNLPRQFGLLGEHRINVLQLSRDLDTLK